MTEQIDLKEIIEDYNIYLARLQPGTLQIANDFRQNKNDLALQGVANFIEGMNWLISANNYFVSQGIPTNFDEKKIVDFFNEINEALSVQDYFLVADLFEYEISDYFSTIKEIQLDN